MEIKKNLYWVYYIGDNNNSEKEKIGKWMYFFNDKKYVAEKCADAVNKKIVSTSKHSNANKGVACFYLNYDDLDAHKKILSFLLENKMIARTKTGRLHNISFKLDKQTHAREYGDEFISNIRLENFLDLDSGEWLI